MKVCIFIVVTVE